MHVQARTRSLAYLSVTNFLPRWFTGTKCNISASCAHEDSTSLPFGFLVARTLSPSLKLAIKFCRWTICRWRFTKSTNVYISPNYCQHVGRGTCKFAGRALWDAGLAHNIANWDIAGLIFICLFFAHSECPLQTRNSESKTSTRNTWFLIPNRSEYLKQNLPRGFKKYDYLRLFTSIRNRNRNRIKRASGTNQNVFFIF